MRHARLKDWTFIAELSGKSGGSIIRPDGTLGDRNSLPRGYWEAKDTQDDLDTEIKRKIARGYPLSNIIFEDTQTGVLFQNQQKINRPYTLGNPKELAALLNQFFSHTEPDIEGIEEVEAGRAVDNNPFLKDIFQACMMHDILHLAIAVRNTYRNSDDFAKVESFLETLYVSGRLQLPLRGILLIGY